MVNNFRGPSGASRYQLVIKNKYRIVKQNTNPNNATTLKKIKVKIQYKIFYWYVTIDDLPPMTLITRQNIKMH